MAAKKNKAEKRKAKLKARKRQAALDLHARNEHLAIALEKLCQPIIPEYIDDSAGIDLVGRKIVYQMGFIAWNIAVIGRGELAAGAFQATRLDAEQQSMLQKEIDGLVQRKYAEYPNLRTAMRDFSVSLVDGTVRIKVHSGDIFPELPSPDSSEPKPPMEVTPDSILSLRKSMGLSQVKFAGLLGVSAKKLSAWEHGRAEPADTEKEKIRNLAEARHG